MKTTRGGVFFLDGDGVTANALLRKLREDAELCDEDPRSLSGWTPDGAVALAIHKPKNGWWAVVDSAAGAPGIGGGAWSRIAMMANHLPTTAIWFRLYEDAGIAVEFEGGGTFLRAWVGTPEETLAMLKERGCSPAAAPSAAGKKVAVAALQYSEEAYHSGPDAAAVARLGDLRRALGQGDPGAVLEAYAAIPAEESRLALGVVRAVDAPADRATLSALAEHFLAQPMTTRRGKIAHITLEEEVMCRVARFPEQPSMFEACIERLDAVEREAYARSSHACPLGLVRVAVDWFHRDQARAAACYHRLATRPEPSYLHVNLALATLLDSTTGALRIEGQAAELLEATEKRLPDLGRDAKDMIRYNLACAYARAGRTDDALTHLEKCRDLRAQNPKPEEDTDFASLFDHPRFKRCLGLPDPLQARVSDLEVSVSTSEALAELGLKTVAELVDLTDASGFSERQVAELSAVLKDTVGVDWRPASVPPPWEPPAERAVPRLTVTFGHEGSESRPVSRLGGRPHAPTADFPWPTTSNRPMDFVLQLVGTAAGGDVDLGDIHLIQVFADLEGEFYEDSQNTVVIHREACPVLLDCPLGVDEAPVREMRFSPGADDRILIDIEWPDEGDPLEAAHRAGHDHAFADKVWGIPTAANLDAESVVDSRGQPMRCLLSLYSYNDWFYWFLFVDAALSEARMEIVR